MMPTRVFQVKPRGRIGTRRGTIHMNTRLTTLGVEDNHTDLDDADL